MRCGGKAEAEGKTHLFRFLVDVDSERRILLLEPIKRPREIRRLLSFRFNSQTDNRFRNKHRALQQHRTISICLNKDKRVVRTHHRETRSAIRKRITRRTLHTKYRTNLSGTNRFDILALTLELSRSNNLHTHNRLQNHPSSLLKRLPKRPNRSKPKRQLARIHSVECAVLEYHSAP